MKPPKFLTNDVEVLSKTTSHEGYFHLDVYALRHRRFAGDWGPEIHREIFERGHAAAVLPFDPVTGDVIMIEQFRAGAFTALNSPWLDDDASPWLYEVVAGIIDEGEDPTEVVRRECIEETGTPVTDLLPVCHYLVSPGGSSESVFIYVGRADTTTVNGVHGLAHEGEDIRPFVVSFEEAYAGIAEGHINNSATIIALQWLKLNLDDVLAAWR